MSKGDKFREAFGNAEVASYEELLGLLRFRRSIRGFRDEPVARESIEKILDAGRWAPSAGNSQPWEFVVVEDREEIGRLAQLYEYQLREKRWLEATQDKRTQMYVADPFPFEGGEPPSQGESRRMPFQDASHLIFCLADERWQQAFPLRTQLDKGHQHIVSSLASAVLAMHLAAAALDLATQWISDFGSPWLSGMTRHLLGIPRSYLIYEVVAVGHPTYYPKPRHVKDLDDVVHYGRYDARKWRTEEQIRDYIAAHIRPKLKLAT